MKKSIQDDTLEAFKDSGLNISGLVRVLGILDDPPNYIFAEVALVFAIVL